MNNKPITTYRSLKMAKSPNTPVVTQATTPTPTPAPMPTSNTDYYKALGIDATQVQENETAKVEKMMNTKADKLKADTKQAVKDTNKEHGSHVTFVGLVRDGSLKDKNGEFILDDEGKKKPRFIQKVMKGYFTIDKREDGLYDCTRTINYSESFLVQEYTELSSD